MTGTIYWPGESDPVDPLHPWRRPPPPLETRGVGPAAAQSLSEQDRAVLDLVLRHLGDLNDRASSIGPAGAGHPGAALRAGLAYAIGFLEAKGLSEPGGFLGAIAPESSSEDAVQGFLRAAGRLVDPPDTRAGADDGVLRDVWESLTPLSKFVLVSSIIAG